MNCNQVLIIPTIECHRFSSLLPTWQEVFIPSKCKALGLTNGTFFFPYQGVMGMRMGLLLEFQEALFPLCHCPSLSLSLLLSLSPSYHSVSPALTEGLASPTWVLTSCSSPASPALTECRVVLDQVAKKDSGNIVQGMAIRIQAVVLQFCLLQKGWSRCFYRILMGR